MIYGSRIPDLGLLGYDVGFQSYFRKDFFLVRAVRIRFSIQNWRHFEDPKAPLRNTASFTPPLVGSNDSWKLYKLKQMLLEASRNAAGFSIHEGFTIPVGSMYVWHIFQHKWLKFMVNLGKQYSHSWSIWD